MNEGAERAIERRLDGRAVLINTHKHRCGPTLRCEEAPQHPKPCFWDRPTTSADEPRQSRPRREVDPLTRLNQTDPPRDRQTHRERTYLADRRLGSPLVLHGAAEVGLCVGCDGGRGGSRPSRPPHGHARAARGAAKVALHGGSGRQRCRKVAHLPTTTVNVVIVTIRHRNLHFMMCQRHQVVAFYINGDPVVLIAGASFHRGLGKTRSALVMKGRN